MNLEKQCKKAYEDWRKLNGFTVEWNAEALKALNLAMQHEEHTLRHASIISGVYARSKLDYSKPIQPATDNPTIPA